MFLHRAIILSILTFVLNGKNIVHAQVPEFKEWIHTLCDTAMGGRPPGTHYEKRAAHFIQATLKNIGIVSHQQPFRYQDPNQKKQIAANNIYVYLNHKADSTIILGAHYDHLGTNLVKSKEIRPGGIHPGANDNASGVAMLIYLLKNRTQWLNKRYNYFIVFYSAHEPGLFGSDHFYKTSCSGQAIKYVLNLDMVGRLFQNTAYVASTLPLPGPRDSLIIVPLPLEQLNTLDTKSFHEHQVPCITITTGMFAEYHTRADVESKLNYTGMASLSALLLKWLQILNRP